MDEAEFKPRTKDIPPRVLRIVHAPPRRHAAHVLEKPEADETIPSLEMLGESSILPDLTAPRTPDKRDPGHGRRLEIKTQRK